MDRQPFAEPVLIVRRINHGFRLLKFRVFLNCILRASHELAPQQSRYSSISAVRLCLVVIHHCVMAFRPNQSRERMTWAGEVCCPVSRRGFAEMNVWTGVHDGVHDGGSRRGFTTGVHDGGSRRGFTTGVHDGGSRRGFTTRVHDESSRRVHDGVHDEVDGRTWFDDPRVTRASCEVHDEGPREPSS